MEEPIDFDLDLTEFRNISPGSKIGTKRNLATKKGTKLLGRRDSNQNVDLLYNLGLNEQ